MSSSRDRGRTAIDGAIALVAVLLLLQMWLLTAALEAFLAGHHETALPAAIASGVIFVSSALLLALVVRVDRRVREAEGGNRGERPGA